MTLPPDEIFVLDMIATWLGVLGIIPALLFIYYYGTEPILGRRFIRRPSDNWKTFLPGRLLMYTMITWVVFIGFVIYRFIHPDIFPFEYLRIGVYVAITVIFWSMFYALRRSQKKGGDPHTGSLPEPPYQHQHRPKRKL